MLAESINVSDFDKMEFPEDRNQVTVIFIFLVACFLHKRHSVNLTEMYNKVKQTEH